MTDEDKQKRASDAHVIQVNYLNTVPEIQSALNAYHVDANDWGKTRPNLPLLPLQDIRNSEIAVWNREYEECRKECLNLVRPLVERSEGQKRLLEEAEKRIKEQTVLRVQNTAGMGAPS
jgi:hypothetical protein